MFDFGFRSNLRGKPLRRHRYMMLERLQEAWLYQLNKLKKGCMVYLFDFGKIYDVRDEINNFFRQADRELMLEMFQEVLTVWKPV